MITKRVSSLLVLAIVFGMNFLLKDAFAASDAPGYPENIIAYDPREVAMLPPYCKYTQEFNRHVPNQNPAEAKRWQELLGSTFLALHHYCWGLMHTNRALYLTRSAQYKKWHLGGSINEFDYVVKRAPSTFVLLPEILTKKGENLIRLGQGPAGVIELQRAIEVKANYWPAYAALSDYFKSNGDRAMARKVLEDGLVVAPEATPLKKRLASVDRASAK